MPNAANRACSYVAERIRRCCSKSSEQEPVKPLAERTCALRGSNKTNNGGPQKDGHVPYTTGQDDLKNGNNGNSGKYWDVDQKSKLS